MTAKAKMTREELLAALRALDSDPEENHARADRLLLDYIGDAEVSAVFEALLKWYS